MDYFRPRKANFGKGSADDQTIPLKVYEEGTPHNTVKGLTSIIIPAYFLSYPLFHQTGNCIGSIREHTNKAVTPYEIILVINGETGIGFAQEDYKDTYADKVIKNEENLGWTKAINQGIRASQGEFTVLMNNDVQVYEGWLEGLQEALGKVELAQAYPMYGRPFARAVEARETEDVLDDFSDFSCFAVRKSLFDEIGLFDETFFTYGSDIDFVKRLESKGKRRASTKKVRIFHVISATASQMDETPKLMDKARELIKQRWGE